MLMYVFLANLLIQIQTYPSETKYRALSFKKRGLKREYFVNIPRITCGFIRIILRKLHRCSRCMDYSIIQYSLEEENLQL